LEDYPGLTMIISKISVSDYLSAFLELKFLIQDYLTKFPDNPDVIILD